MRLAFIIGLVLCTLCVADALRVRRNQASLSDEELQRFINTVLEMKRRGVYDQFVRIHQLTFLTSRSGPIVMDECKTLHDNWSPQCFDWGHGGPHFLPWHRQFLKTFEAELHKIDPEVDLVYWDWTVDNSTDPAVNRLFGPKFMGGDGDPKDHHFVKDGPFVKENWPLRYAADGSPYLQRQFGGNPENFFGRKITLPEASNQAEVLTHPIFDEPPYLTWGNISLKSTFRKTLEGFPAMRGWSLSFGGYLHARVHTFVSGSMLPASSPNDLLFFMHHTNIDRLWSSWAKRHPDVPMYQPQSAGPPGTNPGDYLIPWDGHHSTDEYEWYFQFEGIVPTNATVMIKEMLKPDDEFGYVYEQYA